MNKRFLFILPCLGFLITACNNQQSDVVDQQFVHKYGVNLSAEEWANRGQDGQVFSIRKDGVTVSETYSDGYLDGETTHTFPHKSIVQRKQMYQQGCLVGETTYYTSGMPAQFTEFQPDGNRLVTTWYETNVPRSREAYAGEYLGEGEYMNEAGQVEATVTDQMGTRVNRDPMGQLMSRDTIKHGQILEQTSYHPNGVPSAVTPYEGGYIEGIRRTYSPMGEPATLESWTRDRQHGLTIGYQNGEKVYEQPYVNGQRVGLEKRYKDGTDVVQEVNWVNDKKHGPSYSYIGDGRYVDWYFEDAPVNKATFDAMSHR